MILVIIIFMLEVRPIKLVGKNKTLYFSEDVSSSGSIPAAKNRKRKTYIKRY